MLRCICYVDFVSFRLFGCVFFRSGRHHNEKGSVIWFRLRLAATEKEFFVLFGCVLCFVRINSVFILHFIGFALLLLDHVWYLLCFKI